MILFQATQNELFLANYGAWLVIPLALLLTVGNFYCCTQLCYKGGFLLPLRDCCRACCRKFVIGVREGSFNRLHVTDITDEEVEAAIECMMVTARLIAHLTCVDNV